jgi:hypothetical protein
VALQGVRCLLAVIQASLRSFSKPESRIRAISRPAARITAAEGESILGVRRPEPAPVNVVALLELADGFCPGAGVASAIPSTTNAEYQPRHNAFAARRRPKTNGRVLRNERNGDPMRADIARATRSRARRAPPRPIGRPHRASTARACRDVGKAPRTPTKRLAAVHACPTPPRSARS